MVIDENGNPIGLIKTTAALALAQEKGLDLVEVSPNLSPPVCKIMDYGKYMYKIAKQKRQQIAKQKKIEVKGIRLSSRIEKHDLEFKACNAVKFMKKGNKVRIDMILKGREKAHIDFAFEKLKAFLEIISNISKSNPETQDKEIIKEKEPEKTPQGLSVVIEYKRS